MIDLQTICVCYSVADYFQHRTVLIFVLSQYVHTFTCGDLTICYNYTIIDFGI